MKHLKEKNVKQIKIVDTSFRKPKRPQGSEETQFNSKNMISNLVGSLGAKKDTPTTKPSAPSMLGGGILGLVKTTSNTAKPPASTNLAEAATPSNQASQRRPMMEMIRNRNATFTESSNSKTSKKAK